MGEHYVLYDKDNAKITEYTPDDVFETIGSGKKFYQITRQECFVFDAASDYLELYDYGKKVKIWSESEVDALNKVLKK